MPLKTVPGVELVAAGTWHASTGKATFTGDDLAAAIDALSCPGVRKPILKLGHAPNQAELDGGLPWDGEPAVGWVDNLRLTAGGAKIEGDYVGVPDWLADIIASAYPDRSVEMYRPFTCQIGHTHKAAMTAVALLGVMPPAVGVLKSLQDVRALYGGLHDATVHTQLSTSEGWMGTTVKARISDEDVRRRYYESAGYSNWVIEVQLEPLQLITCDDASGKRFRVPVQLAGEKFEFGKPVEVAVEYVDVGQKMSAVTYASRDESLAGIQKPLTLTQVQDEIQQLEDQLGVQPNPQPDSPPEPVDPDTSPPPPPRAAVGVSAAEAMRQVAAGAPSTAVTSPASASPPIKEARVSHNVDAAKIREALGLAADASEDDVRTALAGSGLVAATAPTPTPSPNPPTPNPDDPTLPSRIPGRNTDNEAVLVDPSQLQALRAAAFKGQEAYDRMRRNERDNLLDEAIKAGKFPPVRRQHYERLWDADPEGTRDTIAALAPNLIPVLATGFPGGDSVSESELAYKGLYGNE
jgi:hypothetical protein